MTGGSAKRTDRPVCRKAPNPCPPPNTQPSPANALPYRNLPRSLSVSNDTPRAQLEGAQAADRQRAESTAVRSLPPAGCRRSDLRATARPAERRAAGGVQALLRGLCDGCTAARRLRRLGRGRGRGRGRSRGGKGGKGAGAGGGGCAPAGGAAHPRPGRSAPPPCPAACKQNTHAHARCSRLGYPRPPPSSSSRPAESLHQPLPACPDLPPSRRPPRHTEVRSILASLRPPPDMGRRARLRGAALSDAVVRVQVGNQRKPVLTVRLPTQPSGAQLWS